MAQSYTDSNGTLITPGAFPQITFAAANSGVSTTGVLAIVGEATGGPDVTAETKLSDNQFGPGQEADVVAKYGSGPIVDAFKAAIAAANDANITGSFSKIIIAKTNVSTRATGSLTKYDTSSYATLRAKQYSKNGNLISRVVVARQAEVVPTTGSFAFVPAINSTNISVRTNGGAVTAITIAAAATPTTVASQLAAVSGLTVTGGADRGVLSSATGTLALTVVSGVTVQIDRSVAFSASAVVGDSLFIPTTSALAAIQTTNAGGYVVTAVTSTSITARKLINAAGSPTVVTTPVNQAATSSLATTDVRSFSPISAALTAANPTDGMGKTLEINQLTTGTDLLSYLCYTTAGVAVSWISTTAAPYVIVSASEYIAKLTASRQLDNITEDVSAGGAIALKIGYTGTTASLVNDGTTLTITVTGGAGTSPAAITLANFPTLADLASYIGSLTGFICTPGTAVIGAQPATSLDHGTFTFGTTFGAYAGRIKQDAYKFYNTLATSSALVELTAQATAGLPAPQALAFLSGGAKGSTTDATFNAAIDALVRVRCNFVVPLFSRDASSDIADSLTDTSSSYTIAGIHAYCRAHVLAMSTRKRKRNRQAFLSIRSTFAVAKETAANIASSRCSMTFQDVKDTSGSTGGIVQYQPWMASVKAAAMQAAGFYRAIVRKGIAISGALQAAADFDDGDDDQVDDALLAGLLPIKQDETGGFYWVSDQTTYGKDTSFALNSIQVMYSSDTFALTMAQRLDRAITGQSQADMSASLILTAVDAIAEDTKRLKLIAPSSDAPKGYKNVTVEINGPTARVRMDAKIAGAIYWIPIDITVSQITQSA